MNSRALLLLAACLLAGAGRAQPLRVSVRVENRSNLQREELAEVPLEEITRRLNLKTGQTPLVTDAATGNALPSQVTFDGLLLFPVRLAPHARATFTVQPQPADDADTLACGAFYAYRKDDLAWENDRSAYRAFGPALQNSGERAYGYDVWTKSVPYPVVCFRYEMNCLPQRHGHAASTAGRKVAPLSFHIDHGTGMDRYAVGPTLGCGTDALLNDSGRIVYPWCFSQYAILDNGPLRFSVRLTYRPFVLGSDSHVVETRLISLDRGSYLNRARISFSGLSRPAPIVVGLVMHAPNAQAYVASADSGYLGYEDLTERPDEGNGQIYVGAAFAQKLQEAGAVYFSADEQKQRGGALGHVLGRSTYKPRQTFEYYFGSGWSKGGMPSLAAWEQYLQHFAAALRRPLKITVR